MSQSLPSLGASIASPLGLLGFTMGCLASGFFWIARREKTKILEQMAQSQRPKALALQLYTSRFLAVLGTAGFVVCFTLVVLRSSATPLPPPQPSPAPQPSPSSTRTADDFLVIDYKHQIMDLRGNVEMEDPKNGRGTWKDQQEGIRLANLMLAVSDKHLHPTRSIMQHEYAGFAFLIVANTFTEPSQSEGRRSNRLRYATAAVGEFNLALNKMQEIIDAFQAGNADAAELYTWITQASEDFDRTHYLKALAMAAIAVENGGYGGQDVKQELKLVKSTFLEDNHAANNSDLAAALAK